MSKDQIVKPVVTTAVAAAAANTTRAMQSRISLPSHAETLTETSLRALDEAHFICNDDTEVRTLFPLTADSLIIWLIPRGSSVSLLKTYLSCLG